ncbi:DNAH1 [Symbiodinium sp. CCMP2456]|nr:DNAH1 [Symbiodinium sp. CCMP2456]
MASCIYANKFTRLMKPEQFRHVQKSAITSMAHKIRDQWVVNIQKIILKNFRDVGKGWFSIHETNQDTYRQGKLKKLLAVVKNMMQDSLEFFTLDSVDDYCHGLEELCPAKVIVSDLMKVECEFVERPRPLPAKRGGSRQLIPPGRPGMAFYGADHDEESADLKPGSALFLLEIKVTEDKAFAYSTSSEAAVDVCGEVLDLGVMSLGDIPQVEPQIVPQLFKTVVVKQGKENHHDGEPAPGIEPRHNAFGHACWNVIIGCHIRFLHGGAWAAGCKKADWCLECLLAVRVDGSSSGCGMFSVYGLLLFAESWLHLVADLSVRPQSRAEFLRTTLRCPSSWEPLLSDLKHAKTLLSAGEAPEARRVLSLSVAHVLGEDADAYGAAVALQRALEDCAVGMGAAFRLLAMSHYGDPVVRDAETEVQVAALEVALRMQHLASGWLIYAYNVAALHHDSFIDDSAWPITSHEFGDEHRSVANLLGNLRAQLPTKRVDADPGTRAHGLTVCLVTICDYPSGRPAAWGKVEALREAMEDDRWDWVAWIDCDLYFMDMNRTLDSLLLTHARAAGEAAAPSIDESVHMLVTEDAQSLNTAILLMRRSAWSRRLLARVWGDDAGFSPFENHTWWEQQAFAQELFGVNHRRFAQMRYEASMLARDLPSPYPQEVRILPQSEMNSYHPISSRLVDETWAPGKFVLSFNGVKSLSGPNVAKVLHANYYEVFCQRNSVEDLCKDVLDAGAATAAMAPWLSQAETVALPALQDYLALFAPYEDLLQLEPAEFVQAKADADITTAEAKNCILEQVQKEHEILESIPESIVVGLFEVSCQEIRKTLAGKHRKIQELLLDMMMTKFRDGTQEITDAYAGVFSQLRKSPKDIEEVTAMREYIATIPAEIMKMAPDTKRCLDTYSVLEEFGVQLTADDFYQRWRVFGCPKSTYDLVAKVEDDIKELEASFAAAQQQEQSDFDDMIVDMANTIENFAQYNDFEKLDEIYENVESVNERLKSAATQAKLFNSRELLFGKEATDYGMIAQLTKEWEPFSQLWVTAYNWTYDSKKWLTGPFQTVDAKSCESSVMAGTKTLFKAVRAFEKREGCDEVLNIARHIKEAIDAFVPKVPIVVGLRNPGMAERHWQQVSNLVGSEVTPTMENFTLEKFVELGMVEHAAAVADIGDRAGKEQNIENQLKSMQAAWDKVFFDCSEPYRTTGTYILKGADEVMAVLDEQIVVTQAMQFSPFNKPFKEDIDEWNDKLMYVSECLDQWLKVQRAWMYLQPIFDSPDIMKQLPTEGKKFKVVDGKWRQTMSRVHSNGHALTQCTQEGLLTQWQTVNRDLDIVQKGLDDYLATKCAAFARFYFLSNDELLEILSQTKDPLRVQPFLSKVFEAMKKLTFTDQLVATQMHSKEGEIIDFVNPVVTKDKNVETWMTDRFSDFCENRLLVLKAAVSLPLQSESFWLADERSVAQKLGKP